MSLVALGTGVMFVLLSYGQYEANTDLTKIGGWVGFITAGLDGYTGLAELLNAEVERPILPDLTCSPESGRDLADLSRHYRRLGPGHRPGPVESATIGRAGPATGTLLNGTRNSSPRTLSWS